MEEKNKAKKNEKSTKLFDYLHQEARKKNQSPNKKQKQTTFKTKTINHNDTPNRIYQHI